MSKLNVFFDSDEDNVKNGSLSSTEIIQIEDDENDRYSRLKLIPWWDQKKLRNAKVMVVGAVLG